MKQVYFVKVDHQNIWVGVDYWVPIAQSNGGATMAKALWGQGIRPCFHC